MGQSRFIDIQMENSIIINKHIRINSAFYVLTTKILLLPSFVDEIMHLINSIVSFTLLKHSTIFGEIGGLQMKTICILSGKIELEYISFQ